MQVENLVNWLNFGLIFVEKFFIGYSSNIIAIWLLVEEIFADCCKVTKFAKFSCKIELLYSVCINRYV